MADPDDSKRPTPDYEVHDASDSRLFVVPLVLIVLVIVLAFFFLRQSPRWED